MAELTIEQGYLLNLLKGKMDPPVGLLNQQAFQELITRHRLLPITGMNRQAVMKSMALSGELVKLMDRLQEHSGNFLVTKGPVLAVILFGKIDSRQYNDLDLHVRPDSFQAVLGCFLDEGYRVLYPRIGLRFPYRYYFRHKQEVGLYHPGSGVYVELHSGFNLKRFLPVSVEGDFFSGGSLVKIMGHGIPTLCHELHFIYLCLHGAKHLYFRLFWLRDIAEYLNRTDLDHDRVATLIRKYGIQRIVGLSLKLAGNLLDARIPGQYGSFMSERYVDRLVGISSKRIFGPEEENFRQKLDRIFFYAMLKPGLSYKCYQLAGVFHRWYISKFLGGH
jgi:hypothetical protein